ncbi:MAG: hypothetical protein JRN34_05375 [Nitrososphaerota archaeon]|jgi:hypothetical protein|nr:hypothetical protein [Nitrososphaerota archaeon]MDG6942801.1 hypothetical protein [Nitrososphaerota archaeon]MDG6950879.1 hypothetical protein [Nitrososphaerota archaeon]
MEFTIKGAKEPFATVFIGGREVATVSSERKASFAIRSETRGEWRIELRDHGEMKPFSAEITGANSKDPVLKIKNRLFFYKGAAYLLAGIPEDAKPADHVLGKRHVIRLDSFPFSNLKEVDPETWGRLRLHRGASVGEIDGDNPQEFRVALSNELEEIGIQLSAALYLLYTSGQGVREW